MRYLLVVFLVLFSYNMSFAERLSLPSDITVEQRLELEKKIFEFKSQNVGTLPATNPEKVNAWIDVGKNLGIALTTAAKELGATTDKFLESNTGKMTAIVILWKMVGKDILHIVFGFVLLVVVGIIWVYMFRRMYLIRSTSTSETGVITHEYYAPDEACGGRFFATMVGLFLLGTCVLIILN